MSPELPRVLQEPAHFFPSGGWPMSSRKWLLVGLTLVIGGSTLIGTPTPRVRAEDEPASGKEQLFSQAHRGIVWSVAWSPNGRLVASGDREQVIVWNPATGRQVWRLPAPHAVSALAFSPDGKTLATVGWDGLIRLGAAATGKLLRSMRGSGARLLTVAWSPDGKLLACGGEEAGVPLWDVSTGKAIRRLQSNKPRNAVLCVAFSPDGRLLVTGRDDSIIPLFEVATGKEILQLPGQTSRTIDAAFSPNGNLLATAHAGDTVRLWNVHTGEERRRLTGHTQAVTAVAFSRDGRLLVSGSIDGSVRVWEALSGRCVLCLRGHGEGVSSVAMAPDGRCVISGGRDSTARIWDVTGLPRGSKREQPLSPSLRRDLWDALADTDAAAAHRAVWRLVAIPGPAVRLLEEELAAVKEVPSERLARLVDELNHDRFRVRQRAFTELERIGEVAVPELNRRLAGKPSLEVRRRVEKLLETVAPVEPPPRLLREVRALIVLAQVGTEDARRVLRSLASGASGAYLTVEAKAALQRLSRARMD
jgi:dipeptidyl aminopeptidase/acylaminoacyl peptidase